MDSYSKLDDVYHSETPDEMCLKMDLLQVPSNWQEFSWLCDTLCYHYGFWPHTRPRFYSFKKILARKITKANPLIKLFEVEGDAIVSDVAGKLASLEFEYEHYRIHRIPGRRSEIHAWRQILRLVEKLYALVILKSKHKKDEK